MFTKMKMAFSGLFDTLQQKYIIRQIKRNTKRGNIVPKLNSFPDYVHELADCQVAWDPMDFRIVSANRKGMKKDCKHLQILLLVNGRNIALLGLFHDARYTVRILLADLFRFLLPLFCREKDMRSSSRMEYKEESDRTKRVVVLELGAGGHICCLSLGRQYKFFTPAAQEKA